MHALRLFCFQHLWYIFILVIDMSSVLNTEMLGKRIKTERTNKRLTQFALADEIGVSQNYLGDIERGVKAPSVTTAIRLANVLNVSLDTLFADSLDVNLSEDEEIYLTDKQLKVLKKVVKEIKDNFTE